MSLSRPSSALRRNPERVGPPPLLPWLYFSGWGMVAERGEVIAFNKCPLLSIAPDIFSPNLLDPFALLAKEDFLLYEEWAVLRERIIKQLPVVEEEIPLFEALLLSLFREYELLKNPAVEGLLRVLGRSESTPVRVLSLSSPSSLILWPVN